MYYIVNLPLATRSRVFSMSQSCLALCAQRNEEAHNSQFPFPFPFPFPILIPFPLLFLTLLTKPFLLPIGIALRS